MDWRFWNNKKNESLKTPPKDVGVTVPPTASRKTEPTFEETYTTLIDGIKFIDHRFIRKVIPSIRKLSWMNEDLGLALNDMVQLTNTGHIIKFDQKITPQERDKMRRHLIEVRKTWGDGVNGIDGLVSKMIAQIWVAGALSNEWVPKPKKDGIRTCLLVNPETIWFSWDKMAGKFKTYQKQDFKTGDKTFEKFVKLNPLTYKYIGINGDTALPYGIPPYLTALAKIKTQANMDKSIDYIMEQLGLLGFFETLIDKPAKRDGETDGMYENRLNNILDKTKQATASGIKDGSIIGFKDDHEFKFNNTTKNLGGASELYQQNQVKLANGLKHSPEFLGFPTSSSESGMSIIFTKMLSQLSTVQAIISNNLEFAYMLELTMAGFKNVTLTVEFKPSTITDELKFQQAQEYKIRNIENKYNMGVIGQQQKAEELGYDAPDQAEPRAPIAGSGGVGGGSPLDKKNTSERKTADKKKAQPKRKDTSTKP